MTNAPNKNEKNGTENLKETCLVKNVSKLPNKIIYYGKDEKGEDKPIDLYYLLYIIYKLFYRKGSAISTIEVASELGYKKAGKFIERVINPHLKSLVSLSKKDGKYYIHPLALVLITNKDVNQKRTIYDFTSIDNEFFGYFENNKDYNVFKLKFELFTLFNSNLEEISEYITLNKFKEQPILKDFLNNYDKKDRKIVLRILIDLYITISTVKTDDKNTGKTDESIKNIEGASKDLPTYITGKSKEYSVGPSTPPPNYSDELKLVTTTNRPEKLITALTYLQKHITSKLKEYSVGPSTPPYYIDELKILVTTNRAEEFITALTYLNNYRVIIINGISGVGKSTFATILADFRPLRVPKPFYFNFNDNQDATLGDILEKLADYLQVTEIASFKTEKREPGKNDVDRLTVELQRRSEIWLIFDDLSKILSEDQRFSDKGINLLFSSLIKDEHNAKVIVTSHILPILDNGDSFVNENRGVKNLHLNGLSTNFAVNYLASHGLNEVEPKKLDELATSVHGHPLTLYYLVKTVNSSGLENILKDVRTCNGQIKKIIKSLIEKFARNEKELLECISVYREPMGTKGLEKIFTKEMFTENTPENAITTLTEKSLLETDHKGKYWLHPLVKELSYMDLKNKKDVHLRAYHYYKSLNLPENPETKEHLKPAIEAYYHACEAEKYDLAAQMILDTDLHVHLENWGYYTTLKDMYLKILPEKPFKDKPLLSEKKTESSVFGKLGNALLQLGNAVDALNYYEHALKITRETGEIHEGINLLVKMGTSYRYQGNPEKEIDCYKQALEIARNAGDLYEETYILGKLGYEFYYRGDIQKEIELYNSVIKIAKKRGDEEKKGEFLALLGTVYSNQGKHEEAIENCKKAVEIADDLKIKRLQEDCLGYLGFAYRCSGFAHRLSSDLEEALGKYKKALEIAKETEDRIGEGRRLGSIGIVYSIQGKTEEAIDQYEIALKIAREMGDKGGEGKWLGCMGLAYSDLIKDDEAIKFYEQARGICEKTGYRRGECEELGFIGNALSDQGKYEEAIKSYNEALEIANEIKDEGKREIWHGALGLTYSDMGEYEEAIKYYKQALKIAKEIEDNVGEENWLVYMCLAYHARGMHTEANDSYIKALEISLNIKDKDCKETWSGALGLKHSDLNKEEKVPERHQQTPETSKEAGNKQRRGIQLRNFDLYPRGAR